MYMIYARDNYYFIWFRLQGGNNGGVNPLVQPLEGINVRDNR